VISADLELAWAWRYARHATDRLADARQRARQGRRNLVAILDACDRNDIPITWATVGHLFLENCTRSKGVAHVDLPRIPYFVNEYWAFRRGDWFDADPASADRSDPEWPNWYGPDLLGLIMERGVRHEIACHSFSHITLSDDHCPPQVATRELVRCQELAGAVGVRLRSLTFPGNLMGNYASLRRAGFIAYRWHGRYDLDAPRRDRLGLWQIPGGLCLDRPNRTWTAADHIGILRDYVDDAIEHGLVGGLWFHPEITPSDVDQVLPAMFEYIASRRSDLWVGTVGGLAQWLETETAA
jgi:peptidoglycan/xylan/chitin deacetylase (PgdA/CDA1 family)